MQPPSKSTSHSTGTYNGSYHNYQMRVLVADDEPGIRKLLAIRLQRMGYEVQIVANGEQALAEIQKAAPDLLFVDVSMPGVGGLEVLRWVRQQSLDVAVIMMTAFGSEQVVMEAMRYGANEYLRKPFEAAEFHTIVERTTSRLRLERENRALQARLDEKRRQLEAELSNAATVQNELLPQSYPTMAGYQIAARCLPARQVGGDFYFWATSAPHLITLALGDVMGKGMPAALLMAMTRTALQAVVRDSPPGEVMPYLVHSLHDDLYTSDRFVTLLLTQLNLETHQLFFVDAGHGFASVCRAKGGVQWLHPQGLPLGIDSAAIYQQGLIELEVGDFVLLYSDGVIDANPALLPDRDAVAALIDSSMSPAEAIDAIIQQVAIDSTLPDDLTIVILKRVE